MDPTTSEKPNTLGVIRERWTSGRRTTVSLRKPEGNSLTCILGLVTLARKDFSNLDIGAINVVNYSYPTAPNNLAIEFECPNEQIVPKSYTYLERAEHRQCILTGYQIRLE